MKARVKQTLKLLNLNEEKVTTNDVQSIYKEYGIDLSEIKELKF